MFAEEFASMKIVQVDEPEEQQYGNKAVFEDSGSATGEQYRSGSLKSDPAASCSLLL